MRAVAIAMVVARHAGDVSATPAFAFGFAGVDVFFVLSGFLITSLLVGEWSRRGGISLRQFYVRRALRLLPALTAFLIVVLIVVPFFEPSHRRHGLLTAAGYSAVFLGNIATMRDASFALPHMWSLAMEEQFYLVWPVTLLLLLRARLPRRVVMAVAIGGAVAVMLARVVLAATGSARTWVLFYSPLHADGLLIGCALGLAYAWRWLPSPEEIRRWLSALVIGASAVFLVVAIKGAPYVAWGTAFGLAVIALCAAVVVYAAIDVRPVAPLGFLTWRPVTYLGEISYALYIWHWPVVYLWPGNLLPVSARVAVSVALAAASYHFVEKPFLRRKPAHTPDATERDAALGPIVLRG